MDYCALSFLSYFKMGTPYFDDFRKATLPPDWAPLHMAGTFPKFQKKLKALCGSKKIISSGSPI